VDDQGSLLAVDCTDDVVDVVKKSNRRNHHVKVAREAPADVFAAALTSRRELRFGAMGWDAAVRSSRHRQSL